MLLNCKNLQRSNSRLDIRREAYCHRKPLPLVHKDHKVRVTKPEVSSTCFVFKYLLCYE